VFECFHVGRTRFLLPPDHLPGKFQCLEKFGKLEKLEKLDQVGDVRPVNMSKFYVEVV
jgi:hypothetical protein